MQLIRVCMAGLFSAAAMMAAAFPAAAESSRVFYNVVPLQTEVSTGDTVSLRLQCSEADLGPGAAVFTFQIPEGYGFDSVQTGADILDSELSYSYQETRLTLLYLDNSGGGSPVEAGDELAVISLRASRPGEQEPLSCTELDSSAVDASGNVVLLESQIEIGSVTATGTENLLPTPTPLVVEEGNVTQLPLVSPTPESVSSAPEPLSADADASPAGSSAHPSDSENTEEVPSASVPEVQPGQEPSAVSDTVPDAISADDSFSEAAPAPGFIPLLAAIAALCALSWSLWYLWQNRHSK